MSENKLSDNPVCRRYQAQIDQLADGPADRIGAGLARHVAMCEACRKRLGEITAVQYLLDRAKWRAMPADTLALCNRQAMKKLETRVRESAKGRKLAVIKPDLPLWQRTSIVLGRTGVGLAAGLAVLAFNWAATGGLYVTHDQFQRLAETHQKLHIGDWDNPENSAV